MFGGAVLRGGGSLCLLLGRWGGLLWLGGGGGALVWCLSDV